MPLLFFGGSFNPVHHGHLICARAVAEAGGFERVIFVPTGKSPHKPGQQDIAPAQDRLRMCELAVTRSGLFEVDGLELDRPGPSYTIETVAELQRRGLQKIHWLIGADMLLYLPNWHRATELVRQIEFVVMARPGWNLDWQTVPQEFRHLQNQVIEAPRIDISGTEIRERVRTGKPIEYLTPQPVCRYIRERGLYG